VEKEAKEDDGGNTVVAAPAKKLGVGTRASVAGAVKSEESGSTSGSLRDLPAGPRGEAGEFC
jgi:hypothetical protein